MTEVADYSKVGVVVIGRNEGERLKRCLRSLAGGSHRIVYVDSGSTDGSVEFAASLGVDVVELDMSKPFTMARGRNAGAERLLGVASDLAYLQFVDGDCEVQPGWLDVAEQALDADSSVGGVSGYRRERQRNETVYNRITDMDWRSPPGEVEFCGGDIMMRVEAFARVGGYQSQMIAGEDPEICYRLRMAGYRLLRLDHEMTLHDAAMTRFSQWWKRAVRSGHAYAEGARLHRQVEKPLWRREVRRNYVWGAILPILILALAWPTYGLSLLGLVLYALWVVRIARYRHRVHGDGAMDAVVYAVFCMLGKVPAAFGQVLFHWRRLRGMTPQLIEYKHPESVDDRPCTASTTTP